VVILVGTASDFGLEMTVTAVEMYVEDMRDLLQPASATSAGGVSHEIRLDGEGDPYLSDVVTVRLDTVDDFERVCSIVSARRRRFPREAAAVIASAGPGNGDAHQHSRWHHPHTHGIITVRVKGWQPRSGGGLQYGGADARPDKTTNITFVELAGCEKYPPLQGQGGALPADASRAQKGLLAVSDVLCALSSRASFVPYRNSKLTYLLQRSLTPESSSIVLANVRSEEHRCTETANALVYAAQIQHIADSSSSRKQPQQAACESTDMDAWIGERAMPLGLGGRQSRSKPWR
jgi:hypothetical protein